MENPKMAMQCGRILEFIGDVAILCTNDFNHPEGGCSSSLLEGIRIAANARAAKAAQKERAV